MSLTDFLEIDNDQSDGLLIVDFSQIVLSTIMATFRPTEDLPVELIRHVIINTIRSNVLKYKVHYPTVVLATDVGPYWRKQLAPYYKGQRKKLRDDSAWNFDAIFNAMGVVKQELIDIFPYHTISIQGVEADDIAGALVHRLQHKYKRILLISSDSDWAQLQKFKNVKQWSPIQKKWVLPNHDSARLHLLEKVIRGDRKDCISNIKSVSDHILNVEARQKAISQKELDIWLHTPPEEWADDFMLGRYYENLKLLDLGMIPDDIADSIVAELDKPVASGAEIYKYFFKNKMKELMGKVSEFIT